jgi:hypothetical protein
MKKSLFGLTVFVATWVLIWVYYLSPLQDRQQAAEYNRAILECQEIARLSHFVEAKDTREIALLSRAFILLAAASEKTYQSMSPRAQSLIDPQLRILIQTMSPSMLSVTGLPLEFQKTTIKEYRILKEKLLERERTINARRTLRAFFYLKQSGNFPDCFKIFISLFARRNPEN